MKVPEIPFFGSLYGKEGVRPEPERTKEIVALEFSDDKQKLQSFQGMVQYLSPFIPHLSDMMLPLRNLLKSDVFEYNSSHVEAFEKVKRTISSAVMLRADSLFLGWGGATPSGNPYNSRKSPYWRKRFFTCPFILAKDSEKSKIENFLHPLQDALKIFRPLPLRGLLKNFRHPLDLKIENTPKPILYKH